jgi:DNA-binding MarR family transcriptional regulator
MKPTPKLPGGDGGDVPVTMASGHRRRSAAKIQSLDTSPAAVPASKAAEDREQEIAHRVLRHWHEAVPNDRMAHLVKDTMRAFDRSLRVRLARHEVQMGHWVYLRILWERDGLTKRELSIEAGVAEPTTFIALRAMEALGYVTLEQRADNRKNVYVFLTPKGRKLRKVLVPLAEEVNAMALQGMANEDVAVARRALLTMLDNLSRDAALGE